MVGGFSKWAASVGVCELYDRVRPDFDTWDLPAAEFDLVISATAFHWLDPAKDGLPAADDVPVDPAGLGETELFGSVEFRSYAWDAVYSTAECLELLSSYSGHRALTMGRRDGLCGWIRGLIEAAGGSVTKRYLNQLSVGISLNQPLA
jgi:hypothetical protein